MTQLFRRPLVSGFLLLTFALSAGAQTTPPSGSPRAGSADAAGQQDDFPPRFEHDVIVPLRQKHPGRSIDPIEYSSERVRDLLPGCRIFIAAGATTAEAGPYIHDRTGKLWNLQGAAFSFPTGAAFAGNEDFADFIISQPVLVEDEAGAIEAGRLFDEIAVCEVTIRRFHDSTRGLTLYDPKRLSWVGREENPRWQSKVRRMGNVWLVTQEWDLDGPPVSITLRPIWAMETDKAGKITELRQVMGWIQLDQIKEEDFKRRWAEEEAPEQ